MTAAALTIFEIVKIALDELYKDASDVHESKVDKEIIKRLGYLSAKYANLADPERKPIDYRDPATRFAYVYKYVAAHGDYIVQVLLKLQKKLDSIFKEKTLRVSCIGGGPGSDIVAILKYLNEQAAKEPVRKVICYLLDGEQGWADAWTELDESLTSKIAVNTNFQPVDVTEPTSWHMQKKFLQADLFTISYFVSEVMSLDKKGKFWKQLFEDAKPGALFLYIDNGSDTFTAYFDKLWKAAGLKLVMAAENVQFTPRFSEQASELADYRKKFDHNPKIAGKVTYRVLRKPG